MAAKFKLVQHDTLPQIDLSLTDEISGEPLDLSDPLTVIRCYFRAAGASVLKDTLLLAKLPGRVVSTDEVTGRQKLNLATPYDVPGRGGRCAVQWSTTSLDTPGRFVGEIEVTFPDGGRLTAFETLQFDVRADAGQGG